MAASDIEPAADFELRARLAEWRQRRAREDEVPPYIVLTNQLLNDIARTRPRSFEELLQLKGMGPSRLERYGDAILALLDDAPAATGGDDESPTSDCGGELRGTIPYRVVIEYHLEDSARRQLIDELDGQGGPLLASMRSALRAGPARVSIRIEADRQSAA